MNQRARSAAGERSSQVPTCRAPAPSKWPRLRQELAREISRPCAPSALPPLCVEARTKTRAFRVRERTTRPLYFFRWGTLLERVEPHFPGSPLPAMCRVHHSKSALLPTYAASNSWLALRGHVPRVSIEIRAAPRIRCLVFPARPPWACTACITQNPRCSPSTLPRTPGPPFPVHDSWAVPGRLPLISISAFFSSSFSLHSLFSPFPFFRLASHCHGV